VTADEEHSPHGFGSTGRDRIRPPAEIRVGVAGLGASHFEAVWREQVLGLIGAEEPWATPSLEDVEKALHVRQPQRVFVDDVCGYTTSGGGDACDVSKDPMHVLLRYVVQESLQEPDGGNGVVVAGG
jgi:hypothetical protein